MICKVIYIKGLEIVRTWMETTLQNTIQILLYLYKFTSIVVHLI